MKEIIFDIVRNSTVDGPGIRTTVFFKGCNLDCKWCHNPEGKQKNPQLMFYADKCKGCGKCRLVCPNQLKSCELCGKCEQYCASEARKLCGKEYTTEQVLDEIKKDIVFYEISNGGVTFSGGECMLSVDFLTDLLRKCKVNGISTAVDTAGNVPWESFLKVMPYTDLILYDIKCYSDDLHEKGTGVSNRLILENLKRLSDNFNGEIIVRIPVIGKFNDSELEMQKIAEFLKALRIKRVELLPYHTLGESKCRAIGHTFNKFSVPEKEKIEEFKKLFN